MFLLKLAEAVSGYVQKSAVLSFILAHGEQYGTHTSAFSDKIHAVCYLLSDSDEKVTDRSSCTAKHYTDTTNVDCINDLPDSTDEVLGAGFRHRMVTKN